MRKFIIAIEADLNDRDGQDPAAWMRGLIGSVRMRSIKSIKVEEVNEHSGVRVPDVKPKPKPKTKTDRER